MAGQRAPEHRRAARPRRGRGSTTRPTCSRADNADLDPLLAELHAAGVPLSLDIPHGTSAAVGNLARRTALEAAIHLIHDGAHDDHVAMVRRYLVRAAERDRLVYRPLAERPLF